MLLNLCIVSDLPKMGGTSTSVLLFVKAEPVVNNTLNKYADHPQSNMTNGTLKVEPVSLHNLLDYTLLNTETVCLNNNSVFNLSTQDSYLKVLILNKTRNNRRPYNDAHAGVSVILNVGRV